MCVNLADWVGKAEAARLLGSSLYTVNTYPHGAIEVRRVEGAATPRYSRADVEALRSTPKPSRPIRQPGLRCLRPAGGSSSTFRPRPRTATSIPTDLPESGK